MLQARQTHQGASFDAMMRESHLTVPSDHRTHLQLQSVLREAADTLGLDKSHLTLVIFARYPKGTLDVITDFKDPSILYS